MRSYLLAILTFCFLIFGAGCKYNKILKNGSADDKLTAAKKYFNKGDYNRALPLLDALIGTYGRRPEGENIYYYYAYTHYGLGDFTTASYNFKNFVKNFPRSPQVAECSFMAAKCAYHLTLPYYLDQTYTVEAIKEIQIFILKHPGTSYVEDSNVLIDELRSKLHKKAYSNSMLYYKMGNYKSSLVAFKNAVADYPGIPEQEELEFLVVKSAYLYAGQSFQSSQIERYNVALAEAAEYLEYGNTSDIYKKEILEIIEDSKKQIERITKFEAQAKAKP